jgi:ATP-dependent DNA helicase RecQ
MNRLEERILAALRGATGPLLAREIVAALDHSGGPPADKEEVKRCLNGPLLKGLIVRDADFRWSVHDPRTRSTERIPGTAPPARLTREPATAIAVPLPPALVGPAAVPLTAPHEDYLKDFDLLAYRPLQREAVEAVLGGRRPLVVLPTGLGKSLCYQLPALALFREQQALAVVLSPLQALMEDQVLELEDAGLTFATFLNANLSAAERRQRLLRLRRGEAGLLYISPEQLRSPSVLALLRERPPALWVVDEAHCVSQWGHDFRPDYRYAPKAIRQLVDEKGIPLPRLALVTATATAAVEQDLRQLFDRCGLPLGPTLAGDPARENLHYAVVPVDANKDQALLREVRQALAGGGCALVYTTTRREAERLAALLRNAGVEARHYHGKLPREDKRQVLEAFKAGELQAVAATSAFGMGINRADVRAVVHHCLSPDLESYVQQSGRAGRDGGDARCVLLFRPDDADLVFFLQGRARLRAQDLRNTFLAVRSLRDRVHHEASEDWFWATPQEIHQEDPSEEDDGAEPEQRDTRIRAALHHLEEFGLLTRAENLSTSVRFDLATQDADEARRLVEEYGRASGLDAGRVFRLVRLALAMHALKAQLADPAEALPLDRLCDESGVGARELTGHVRELEAAGVCTFAIPLTFVLVRGATGDARHKHEAVRALEAELLGALERLAAEGHRQANLRGLAARLDPDRRRKIRAALLRELLEGWEAQGWVTVHQVTRDIVRFGALGLGEKLARHRRLSDAVLARLYEALKDQPRGRQQLACDLNRLVGEVAALAGGASPEEVQPVLAWLHDRRIVRVSEGLNLFQQAFKLRVRRGARVDTVGKRYPQVQGYYDEQTRRVHLMLRYGRIEDPDLRARFVEDYFRLPRAEFLERHEIEDDSLVLPLVPGEYDRILGELNAAQRAAAVDDSPALAIVAGPGSGKTRTIVHRIAYLVKVQRVDPGRILALAYNRGAVRQLRLRLRKLIGPLAARLRVFTFHGLALALLGRTLGQSGRPEERDFERLLQEACELIEKGEQEDDLPGDTQARRVQLLGNLEYIFVDEYQDVAETEYRLIRLLAGLGEGDDETRPVQINLCVIGDDDQNIYAFRGTSNQYLRKFEEEYRARRLLLTENYRSAEPIIAAANRLIRNNPTRLKRRPEEQVCVDARRKGTGGHSVRAYFFAGAAQQAAWVSQQVQRWLGEGTAPQEVAILAREWNNLSPVRLLLERAGVPTSALNRGPVRLLHNRAACLLAEELRKQAHRVWGPGEPVEAWVRDALIARGGRRADEPTVRALLQLAAELDAERGLDADEPSLPISADDVLTALYESSQSNETYRDEGSVLVTSCHGSKGLEFDRVILLTDNFVARQGAGEEERRLFYVAMTRARAELALCGTWRSDLVEETGVPVEQGRAPAAALPRLMVYRDLTPGDVYLSHHDTRSGQAIIRDLCEGGALDLRPNPKGDGWLIQTARGQHVGALSRRCNQQLAPDGLRPRAFSFAAGEVRLHAVYRHLNLDEVTGDVREDWFVPIPQIRVCR